MFIGYAFFKGTIKSGGKKNFHTYWRYNLTPLWSVFPNLLELRILRDIESDCADSRFPLAMAMRFEFRNHIEEALASPTRWDIKETSKNLFEMFWGSVIHTVFSADQFVPFAAG